MIDGLHEQAAQLSEQDRENPDVVGRLHSIDRRYKDLLELAELREQRLKDALSLYKFYNDADNVDSWIEEKEAFLQSLEPTPDAEELAIVKQRFDTFEKEMNLTEGKGESELVIKAVLFYRSVSLSVLSSGQYRSLVAAHTGVRNYSS